MDNDFDPWRQHVPGVFVSAPKGTENRLTSHTIFATLTARFTRGNAALLAPAPSIQDRSGAS